MTANPVELGENTVFFTQVVLQFPIELLCFHNTMCANEQLCELSLPTEAQEDQ